jgi:hypothetical protein
MRIVNADQVSNLGRKNVKRATGCESSQQRLRQVFRNGAEIQNAEQNLNAK